MKGEKILAIGLVCILCVGFVTSVLAVLMVAVNSVEKEPWEQFDV